MINRATEIDCLAPLVYTHELHPGDKRDKGLQEVPLQGNSGRGGGRETLLTECHLLLPNMYI